jgi:hypothetical protein
VQLGHDFEPRDAKIGRTGVALADAKTNIHLAHCALATNKSRKQEEEQTLFSGSLSNVESKTTDFNTLNNLFIISDIFCCNSSRAESACATTASKAFFNKYLKQKQSKVNKPKARMLLFSLTCLLLSSL